MSSSFINLVKPYLFNSWWLILEHLFKALLSLIVVARIAIYLGPSQFGLLNYALAFVGIFLPLCRLGLDAVLVKKLSEEPEAIYDRFATAFSMVTIASISVAILIALYTLLFETNNEISVFILTLTCGLLFYGFFNIDAFFQAKIAAKYSSLAKMIAFLLGSTIKLYLVYVQADIIYFLISYAADNFILAVLYVCFFKWCGFSFRDHYIRSFNFDEAKKLLQSSWPMVMSGLAGILLIKVDQIMINQMIGAEQLGIYSAGSRIFEGWISFTYVFSVSALPLMIKLKLTSPSNYKKNITILFAISFWASFVFALAMSIFAESILLLIFNEKYIAAKSTLIILSWASVFVALGYMTSRYLVVEGREKYIAGRNWIALLLNVIFNYLFIPIWGISGSAWATLVTMFIVHYAFDYYDNNLKTLFEMKNNAVFIKLRNGKFNG